MKLSSRHLVFIVLCGVIMSLSLGQRHSFGLFLVPVTTDWGWGRETFSIAIALQNLVWGLAQPFSGMLADRVGARRVMVLGGLLYASGVYLMPYSDNGLLFAITAGLFIGLGLSGTAFGIVYGAVGKAVSAENRPGALGLVGAIGGLGQLLMLPMNMQLLDRHGWVTTSLVMSIVLASIVPLALATGKGDVQAGDGATGGRAGAPAFAAMPEFNMRQTLAKAFTDRDFWLLTIGFLACGFQLAFIGTHMPGYLADNGLAPTVATTALGLIALTNIAGTFLFGAWGARWLRKTLTVWLYLGRAGAIVFFLSVPLAPWTVYVFAAVMGFLWLATVPLMNGMLGQIFGIRYVSTLFGFVFLSHQIGSFLGVWLGGWMFDRLHSYTAVWMLACVLSLLAAMLHAPVQERRPSTMAAVGA
jgi:MFS family permease